MTKIKPNMKPVNTIVTRLGVGESGDVQRFVTATINRRIGRYMPHLTGVLETKLKHISGPAEITVEGPYARATYFGKVMVDSVTGKGPANIPGIGLRFRNGVTLKATDRDMEYTKTFNPNAGPFWERRLMAAEGKHIVAEVQRYVDRKARGK